MIRHAFNVAHRLHSREMTIRRPTVGGDMYQTGRVSPSNYFRFLSGPSNMIVPRREFVIAADTLSGEFAQILTFDKVATAGTFQLAYNGNPTTDLAFNINAASLQIAARLVPALQSILVTGDITAGFVFTFRGFGAMPLALVPQNFTTLVDVVPSQVTPSVANGFTPWAHPLQIGDKISHPEIGPIAAADIELLADLGGAPLGFRVRTE